MKHRVQITTDDHNAYLEAVERTFGANVDYSMLVKQYREAKPTDSPERKYSPGACCGAIKTTVQGSPDAKHVSTSYVERQNLTIRMSMRRFTRLTNAFSKKVENLRHAVALHFVYYNYCRVHQTLRVTPAMAAGLTDSAWTLDDLVDLIERRPASAAKSQDRDVSRLKRAQIAIERLNEAMAESAAANEAMRRPHGLLHAALRLAFAGLTVVMLGPFAPRWLLVGWLIAWTINFGRDLVAGLTPSQSVLGCASRTLCWLLWLAAVAAALVSLARGSSD